MEIVEGVHSGEKVVFMGQQNLSEGAKVSIQQTASGSPESNKPGRPTSTDGSVRSPEKGKQEEQKK
jgi:hypothetical protein